MKLPPAELRTQSRVAEIMQILLMAKSAVEELRQIQRECRHSYGLNSMHNDQPERVCAVCGKVIGKPGR